MMLSEEVCRLFSEKEKQVKRNRSIIMRLFNVVRLLSRLGLPFRGHSEEQDSMNRGVFLEFIEFMAASGDEILRDHLDTSPYNAKYTSPQIQNEMIETIGTSLQEKIVSLVQEAGVFSVLMDETTDISHKEQVAICLRYVEEGEIVERLLTISETDDVKGESLTNLLLETLKKHQLDVGNIVGQGYDGGSNMMSARKGVQSRIREINPSALFTHCYSHSLNRALINSLCNKENRFARDFFGIVEQLFVFVEGSALRHTFFLECQKEIAGTSYHLQGISDTRWNCRAKSLERLQQDGVLKAILNTLEHVADTTSDGQVRGTAVGLIATVNSFRFILCLCVITPVLSVLNDVSEVLQKSDIDLLQANRMIRALSNEYKLMRCDEKWNSSLQAAENLAQKLEIVAHLPEERTRKKPRRYDDGLSVGTHLESEPERNLKVSLFLYLYYHSLIKHF